jgi:acetyl-CoA synthetase
VTVFQDVVAKYPTTCEVEWVDAEDPLFLLYTSGSTGKPKVAILHDFIKVHHSFYMVYSNIGF